MTTLKPRLAIMFAVVICSITSACGEKAPVYRDKTLNLVEPVEVVSWVLFSDGGSIEIGLRDCRGKTVLFYYDLSGEGSKKNRHIYIGRMSEDLKDVKQVPLRSPVEREIANYVAKWMESHFPDFKENPSQNYIDSHGMVITSEAISGLIEDLRKRNP